MLFCSIGLAQEKGVERGKASHYEKDPKTGRTYKRVANYPEKFDPNSLTAAHKTLPFGSIVRVKNLANGKTVQVRVNNRGPYIKGRIIDLTPAAFKKIAPLKKGVTDVELEVVSLGKKKS